MNAYKWIPDIDFEKCNGCGKCIEACTPKSLRILDEEFVYLARADLCGSEGHCEDACDRDAIHMEWIEMTGDGTLGRWRTVILP